MKISSINSSLTLEYVSSGQENLYLERKSAKVSLQDLANEIASFANANGGTLVVGISDSGIIEGFNFCGTKKLNECEKVVTNYLKPTPICKCELVPIKNYKNEDDYILLFHIEPEINYIVKNNKDEVYYREGDSSIKLTLEQIRSLEYDRRERDFEGEILIDTSIEDIDLEMVELYKQKIDTDISNEQLLKARGFLKEKDGDLHLTKAGILLFGKNPSVYLPGARVRVLKFEGNTFQLGAEMNIVKDRTFDSCLYKTIEKAKEFINSQLREFTHLNPNGIFETVPEYPEFAWYEGLINAVIHRDYSNNGDYITIKLFDDRLEIKSPGKLGGFVTIDTMKTKRYSRNPQISRVLNEMGIVRELNEGVKRIYIEMKNFFLKEPVYTEPEHSSVLLVLDNNIVTRSKRKEESMLRNGKIKEVWDSLNYAERKVLTTLYDKGEITSEETAKLIERSKPTAVKMLNKFISMDLIVWTGTSKADTHGKYIIK